MGRVFLCVSAACVQRRRSGRYSPIDRTGLSDCQREFIFPTISLSLSLSLPVFSHPTYSPLLLSLFSHPRACSLYCYPFSLTLRPSRLPFSPPFPSLLSPSPRIIIDLRPRTSPGPSFHCTSFVSSLSFSFSFPLCRLLPLSVTILSCAR